MTKRDINNLWQNYQTDEIESNILVTTWISSKLNNNTEGHVLPTLIQFHVHGTSIVKVTFNRNTTNFTRTEYVTLLLLYLWAKYEPIWLNFTGKTDFDLQYTIFKNQCFDSKIQPYVLIFRPKVGGEVMGHTLFLIKFVLLFKIKRKISI